MRLSIARLFASYRLLEATLDRERVEHAKELSRVNAERSREREDRRAAERRADMAEERLHGRESEFFYKLSALAHLPASATEIAEVIRARSQVRTPGEKTVSMGVHTIGQIRRKQERESAEAAALDRARAPSKEELQDKMEEEAQRYGSAG